MTGLVPAADAASLERLDPAAREVAVTQYLSEARSWLAVALKATGPETVATVKAEIAMVAEATKQLRLSREIQQDAQEMVRRFEYALGKAIRAGQERGEIKKPGDSTGPTRDYMRGSTLVHINADADADDTRMSSADFITGHERMDVYAMSDGVTEPEFEAALADARAEGNVSRANVVRKVRGVKSEGLAPVEKLQRIRELAPRGYTSSQIASEIGVGEEWVRKLARDNQIDIAADRTMGRSRRGIDPNRVMQETVNVLDGLVTSIALINLGELDRSEMTNWANSLNESVRVLNRFVKQIKELAQ